MLPKDQAQRLAALGAAISAGTLSRIWQMLLKALDEVRRAPDPGRCRRDGHRPAGLCRRPARAGRGAEGACSDGEPMPRRSRPSRGRGGGGRRRRRRRVAPSVARQPPRPAPAEPARPADLRGRRRPDRREARDRPADGRASATSGRSPSSPGPSTMRAAPGAPVDLARGWSSRLKEWTGRTWLIAAQGGGGAESACEKEKREQREERAEIEADPFVDLGHGRLSRAPRSSASATWPSPKPWKPPDRRVEARRRGLSGVAVPMKDLNCPHETGPGDAADAGQDAQAKIAAARGRGHLGRRPGHRRPERLRRDGPRGARRQPAGPRRGRGDLPT